MDFWLVWHSLAMVSIVGASFTAGFFTCKIFASKTFELRKIKKQTVK
jgi:hypothetical protein